jgi:hypothetical protein
MGCGRHKSWSYRLVKSRAIIVACESYEHIVDSLRFEGGFRTCIEDH